MTQPQASNRRSRRFVLAFTLASAAAAWLLLKLSFTLPSDAELERQLRHNREGFAQLLALAQADEGLEAIDLGSVRPASLAIPAERIERYRALLARSELRALVRERGEVELVAATTGAGGRIVTLGFVRPSTPPAPQVAALERLAKTAVPGTRAYVPVGDGWYLSLSVR